MYLLALPCPPYRQDAVQQNISMLEGAHNRKLNPPPVCQLKAAVGAKCAGGIVLDDAFFEEHKRNPPVDNG